MRRLFTLLIAVPILIALFAAPAMGAIGEEFRIASTQDGVLATASWDSCTPDTPEPGLQTCSFVSVQVFDGKTRFREGSGQPITAGSLACVNLFSAVFTAEGEFVEPLSDESGCDENLDEGALTVADDLSSVTLATTIAVDEFVCDEVSCEPVGDPRDVVVDVTWTAVSEAVAFRERNVSHSSIDGQKCTFMFSGSGERADATATGTVDGIALGEAGAQISRGRQSFSERCR
jgi:hypothetical protein